MAESVQKNFRMSQGAIKLLHSVARARGMTETEVVETCVAKYALEIGQDVDRAKELLFQQICGAAAKSPISHARAGGSTTEEAGHEGEARREGRGGVAAQAETAQSAAGALASMVGEKWSDDKKEKGKKTGLHRGQK